MIVTQDIARLMSPEDRAALGPVAQLNSEAGSTPRHRSEIAEQKIFAAWLKIQQQNGRLWSTWQRTNRPTSGKVGQPDFIIALPGAKSLWLEFKAPGNSLSKEQQSTLALLGALDHRAVVVYAADEAIRLVKLELAV
jgi:hypothetical protein